MSEETRRLKAAHHSSHLQLLDKADARKVKIQRLFNLYDTDSSGAIEFEEFDALLKDFCIPMKDEEATRSAFDDIDTDHNQSIDLKEFTYWYLSEGKEIKRRNKFASTRLKFKKRMSMNETHRERAKMSLLKEKLRRKSVEAEKEYHDLESTPERVVHHDQDHVEDTTRTPSRKAKRFDHETRISPSIEHPAGFLPTKGLRTSKTASPHEPISPSLEHPPGIVHGFSSTKAATRSHYETRIEPSGTNISTLSQSLQEILLPSNADLEHPPGILSKASSNSLAHAELASTFEATESPVKISRKSMIDSVPPGYFAHTENEKHEEDVLPLRRNLALYLQRDEKERTMFSPTIPRSKKETNRIPKSEISISMSPSFKISSHMLRVLTRRRLQSWIQEMDTCTSRGDVVTMEALLRCHGPTWNHLRPLIRERVYGTWCSSAKRESLNPQSHLHTHTRTQHSTTGTNAFVNALVNLRFPCFFNSFLHSAVRSGSEKAVELLLEYDADVEARDADLRTPLHISVLAGDASLHISDILLAHVWQSGKTETPPWILSSSAATSNGLSVLDVARTASCENENTIQWLLSNGAQSALKQEQEKETSMTLNMKTSSSSSSSKSTTVEEEKMNDPIFQYYFSKEMSRLDTDRDLKPEELEMMFDIPDSIALSVVDSDGSRSSGVVSNQQPQQLSNDDEGKIYDFESHTFKSEENSPVKVISTTKKNTKISPSSGLKSRHWISDSTAIRAKLMRNVRRKRLEEVKTNS